jgi:PAS domain S-box-containing protein
MNLRKKTLIAVGLFLACLILILYTVAQIQLTSSFSDLEEHNAEVDVGRALNAISNELTGLSDLANFWAARDDIYAFVTTGNPEAINYSMTTGSLTNDSLRNTDINLLLFLNSYGQIVFSRFLNFSGQEEVVPRNLIEQLSLYGFCPGCLDKLSRFSGIILLFDHPMMIVTHSITNSKKTAPSVGKVVLGRFLTQREVDKLSDITQLNLTIYPLNDPGMPQDFLEVQSQLSHSSSLLVKLRGDESIAGYALLDNIYGDPVMMLGVNASREVYKQGAKSMEIFVILFSGAGLLLLALTLLYLDRSILFRLVNLTAGITSIERDPEASAFLNVQGEDELAQLAISINDMLAALQGAHQELIKSERRYKGVVEDLPDLICRYTSAGTINFVNTSFCTFFSRREEELIGKRIDGSDFEVQVKSATQLMGKLSAGNPTITYESQYLAPEGKLWILWTSRGIFDISGSLIEIQSVGKEITSIKAAEEALQKSESRYHQLVDQAPVGILLSTPEEVAYINRAGARFLGASYPDEVLGKKLLEIVHPDYHQIAMDRVKRVTEDAQSGPLSEEKYIRLDGKLIDVEVAALPFSIEKDEPAVQVIFLDITQRKKAEAARKESEERYRLLAENMTDVIHLHSPDPELRFVYVSPSIRITGYEPSDLVGKSPFEMFFAAEDAETITQALIRFMDSNSGETIEYRAIMKDGSRRWVETVSSPVFDKEGNLIYIANSSRDITQRKRAEEALRESQQQMSDIISFMPEAIMAIDLNGKVMIWNQAMENLTGVMAKDILGKGDYEYSLPFYGYRRPILVDMVLKPHEGWEEEYVGFKREGTAVVGEVFIPSFSPRGSYLLAKATILCDEIGNTVGAIESVRDMTDRRRMEQNLERSRTELHVAAEIQKSFIPKKTPTISNFEISAVTMPALEVGGDFYDFISLPEGKYGLVIADVAGKSIPAALFMALSRMILRTSAVHQSQTSEVLKNANNTIASEATAGMFVTLLYGILDGEALTFQYATAGHPTPILFRGRECRHIEEEAYGIALGVREGSEYEEQTIKFEPGDVAVFYTDGITEA